MNRPPRPPGQHILGAGAWQRLLLLAVVVTASCLAAALTARAWDLPWQSVLFLALLAGQLGVVLGLRSRLLTKENLFLPWRSSPPHSSRQPRSTSPRSGRSWRPNRSMRPASAWRQPQR